MSHYFFRVRTRTSPRFSRFCFQNEWAWECIMEKVKQWCMCIHLHIFIHPKHLFGETIKIGLSVCWVIILEVRFNKWLRTDPGKNPALLYSVHKQVWASPVPGARPAVRIRKWIIRFPSGASGFQKGNYWGWASESRTKPGGWQALVTCWKNTKRKHSCTHTIWPQEKAPL